MAPSHRRRPLAWIGRAGSIPLAVLGMAVTGTGPGDPDPLDPARAVRRALADAGRKVVDVRCLTVSDELAAPGDEAAAFARKALGPRGAEIGAASMSNGDVIAAASAAAVRQAGRGPMLAMVVLACGRATLALCAVTTADAHRSDDD